MEHTRLNPFYYFLILCLIPIALLSYNAVQAQDAPTDGDNNRQAIAESGIYSYRTLRQAGATAASASSTEYANALDIPLNYVQSLGVSGNSAASAVFPNLGVIDPRQGDSFVVMSSGIAGASQTEPGTDFDSIGTSGDRVTLTLVLSMPAGTNKVSFDYKFLTSEYPDYVGSIFNDTFVATVYDDQGLREVARSSVNTSAFLPASYANSDGTGFDLFTPYPSGVDSSFPGGQPDAGLTDFEIVNFPVYGETVTLTFSVEDRGDGILDSAVILDNLSVMAIETIDITTFGDIDYENNVSTLALHDMPVRGAAADGVTRILLRTVLPSAGSAQFCVQGDTYANGKLFGLDMALGQNCVTVDSHEIGGSHYGFAIYQAPESFNNGGYENAAERTVQLDVSFNNTTTSRSFVLVRPPVVLIHGLCSSGAAWDAFPVRTDNRFVVEVADYQKPRADDAFSQNVGVPGDEISDAFDRMRFGEVKYAVVQAELVGHSMGGILSRLHVAQPDYLASNNYYMGDVNRIITLNTPHDGAPGADLIVAAVNLPFVGGAAETAIEYFMKCDVDSVDGGAVDDLQEDSPALEAIPLTTAPGHAIYGTGGSDIAGTVAVTNEVLSLLPGWGKMYIIISFFIEVEEALFHYDEHDAIVTATSQRGGLSGSAVSHQSWLQSVHTNNTSSSNYANNVISLLNFDPTGPQFGYFPSPSTYSQQLFNGLAANTVSQSGASMAGAGVTLSTANVNVHSGDSITVQATLDVGIDIDSVLFVSEGNAIIDDTTPFEATITIPSAFIGDYPVIAYGKNSITGEFYTSNELILHVTPNAQLLSISFLETELFMTTIGETEQLTVLGHYSDGITRDLTDLGVVVFQSSVPAVASVSSTGLVTANSLGATAIIAQYQGLEYSITARVVTENLRPIADAGDDFSVEINEVVTLDASASFDPDNGPEALSYEWLQLDGPAVSLSNPTSVSPSFTVTEYGVYVFSVVVRDGLADSHPSSVTININRIPVWLDIKPNSVYCAATHSHEIIPFTIYSTNAFDALTIDHNTVTLAGGSEAHTNQKTGEVRRHEEDVNYDGLMDLVFHVRLGDTTICAEDLGEIEVSLVGYTFGSYEVYGTDMVRIKGKSENVVPSSCSATFPGTSVYTPNVLVTTVFNVPSSYLTNGILDLNGDSLEDTLSDALKYGSNQLIAVALKMSVNSLLYSEHPNIDYPLDWYQVVADFNAATTYNNRAKLTKLIKTLEDYEATYVPVYVKSVCKYGN